MKTLLLLAILLLAFGSQTHARDKMFLKCLDSSRVFYHVVQTEDSSQGVLQKMEGKKVVASRAGTLEGAGQLNTYFVRMSDKHGVFLLVGTDANSGSGYLSGTLNAFGVRRGITCQPKR